MGFSAGRRASRPYLAFAGVDSIEELESLDEDEQFAFDIEDHGERAA
ncbi:MAG TPA: hypothetical protein VGJ40_01620 [Gaiellaceae bacterium]|jgi:hypothetical protein